MKFIVFSQFGELLDLADYLANVEKHKLIMFIDDKNYKRIGDNIVEKTNEWWRYLGQGYIWIIDSCAFGDFQDWLREIGENVFGGSKIGDELENNRQLNQEWFRDCGFYQPESNNFTDIDEAISFIEDNKDKKWILKQNGDAPKALNHLGKFDDNEDMLFHLKELKKGWNEQEFGKFDCDLMEVVEGLEVAASAFFNGKGYMKNSQGKIVGFLNYEEKKESDGGLGVTTGEMGTTFEGVDEDNDLFRKILLRPKIVKKLKELGFRGVFDINCIVSEKGITALEPTMRFGIPATSYEFIEGMESNTGKMIYDVAKGLFRDIEIKKGFGMVMCVVSKPFPIEAELEDSETSLGEKLWILNNKNPVKDFIEEQKKHIHLYNFEKCIDKETDEMCYKVITKSGYLLTVTGIGYNIKDTRDKLIEYIKNNIYISGMKYRQDIGKRIEQHYA